MKLTIAEAAAKIAEKYSKGAAELRAELEAVGLPVPSPKPRRIFDTQGGRLPPSFEGGELRELPPESVEEQNKMIEKEYRESLRAKMKNRMMEAAKSGAKSGGESGIVLRDLEGMPLTAEEVRPHWGWIEGAELDAWFEKIKTPYRVHDLEEKDFDTWEAYACELATRNWHERRAAGEAPEAITRKSIAGKIAKDIQKKFSFKEGRSIGTIDRALADSDWNPPTEGGGG